MISTVLYFNHKESLWYLAAQQDKKIVFVHQYVMGDYFKIKGSKGYCLEYAKKIGMKTDQQVEEYLM